jgi:hypothetical protein
MSERDQIIQQKLKKEQDQTKKYMEKKKETFEDLELIKQKRNEKLHRAIGNRDHNLKTREHDLKK